MKVDWETCTEPGCGGVRLSARRCLAHLHADGALERAVTEDHDIDARGVPIDPGLLKRILEEAGGRLRTANFEGATFDGDAVFDHPLTFEHSARFAGATFEGRASFWASWFRGNADFSGTRFRGEASFNGATFDGDAKFRGAEFEGEAVLTSARFATEADFARATFGGDVRGYGARFEHGVDFSQATFRGSQVLFAAHCKGSFLEFRDAAFHRTVTVGPVVVEDRALMDGATFHDALTLLLSAEALECVGTRFLGRTVMQLRWAEVALDGAEFARPSVVAAAGRLDTRIRLDLDESGLAERCRGPFPDNPDHTTPHRSAQPRVVSLRRADVEHLVLSGVDLRACRFTGAHHLDGLRLESVVLPRSPDGWRWTPRQTLAEEHEWRSKTLPPRKREGWYPPACRPPFWLESSAGVSAPHGAELLPHELAAAYRDLRKGSEDAKDAPGAADFYYGEMEMRRQRPQAAPSDVVQPSKLDEHPVGEAPARPASWGERLILRLYWLVSGYGLRASRAFAALTLTVILFAFLFDWFGFSPDQAFGRTLLFSIESTSSLFRPPEMKGFALTAAGEVMQVALRVLGPLFLGLALLALRGRVKR